MPGPTSQTRYQSHLLFRFVLDVFKPSGPARIRKFFGHHLTDDSCRRYGRPADCDPEQLRLNPVDRLCRFLADHRDEPDALPHLVGTVALIAEAAGLQVAGPLPTDPDKPCLALELADDWASLARYQQLMTDPTASREACQAAALEVQRDMQQSLALRFGDQGDGGYLR